MLTKSDLQTLATVFGKSVEDIGGAITSEEEVNLDLRLNGKVYAQNEIDNLKKTHTDAGVEIGTKKLASALGVTLDAGEKDPEKLAEKFKTTVASSLEEKYKNPKPGEDLQAAMKKATEWESKYEKLLKTYEDDKSKLSEWEQKYSGLQSEIKTKGRNEKIISSFPDKMKMDRSDALLIFNNTFSIAEDEEGNQVIKRGDKIVQDAVGNPEALDNVVKSFVEEKKWIKVAGMGGDGSSQHNGARIPKGLGSDEAMKYVEEKGLEPMSNEGLELFNKLTEK